MELHLPGLQTSMPDDQRNLIEVLREYNVEVYVVDRHVGPRTITYQVRPGAGVTVAAVLRRMEDVGVALGAASCVARVETGRLLIEVGRADCEIPRFDELELPVDPRDILVGVDGMGKLATIRLDKAAHAIVAGVSGSGKSVALQVIMHSLLRRDDLVTVVCDCKGTTDLLPKTPSLRRQWARDPTSISYLVAWVSEVLDVRTHRRTRGQALQSVLEIEDAPVVLIVDEVQALDRSSRTLLKRILEQGRQWGVHCIITTQDPSAKNLGNELRVNCPTRLTLKVVSASDSRVALGEGGAEHLLGRGDALLKYDGRTVRLQIPSMERA